MSAGPHSLAQEGSIATRREIGCALHGKERCYIECCLLHSANADPLVVYLQPCQHIPGRCGPAGMEILVRVLRGGSATRFHAFLLAETGQLPLPAYWTLQVARFVSNLQAMGGERVARLAMLDSVALAADTDTGLPLARQPWAAQVSRVLAAAGAPCDLTADEGVAIPELAEALLERHVASYTHASVKVQRYIEDVWGGSISAEAYTPASFLCDVPERRRRVRLAQWRTGSHWMAEETGRWQRLDRTQRPCPHCQAPLEDVRHAVYDCPLYAGLREEYAELFHSPGHALPSLAAFLGQARQGRLARFADRCHEEHAAALAQ